MSGSGPQGERREPTQVLGDAVSDRRPRGLGPADRYVPIDDIAEGGMGTVERVWDTLLQRMAARKVLREDGADGSRGTTERFLRKARITARLAHPGVVPIHDLELGQDGEMAFTMTLIEGETLEDAFDRMRRGDPEWTLARGLHCILRVCDVIAYAHSRGVLHRDLKPANVMVGAFGETYVVDWGLAKVVRGSEEPLPPAPCTAPDPGDGVTLNGSVLGTPSYMPPEQADGRTGEVDERSDVYSIGAILYHLLTGRKPYATSRDSKPAGKILELVRRGPPTPVRKLRPGTPPELVSICEKAMARSAADRYPSAAALGEDLRAFTEGRVVAAYEQGFFAEVKKLVQRKRGHALSLASLALVSVGALAFVTVEHTLANRRLEAANTALRAARRIALQRADEAARRATSERGAVAAEEQGAR